MADRSIVVKMRADIGDLQSKMRTAAKDISGIGDAADSASKKSGTKLGLIGTSLNKGLEKVDKNSAHINTLGNGFLTLGVAAAAGVGVAIKKFADFDQSMSLVAASGADARANMDALRAAAIQAGADTAFSASEAAGGIEALAKAGVNAEDTLGGGLKGALDLAASGNLGVAESAEAAATAMSQFGLSGKDVPRIADLLAQAAGTAQGEVSDMAAALNNSGVAAATFGLSIDDTAKVLALFAKNGIVGAEAGTALKSSLAGLFAPSAVAQKELDRLGISAYDAAGNMRPISDIMQTLQDELKTLDAEARNKALEKIFGREALQAGTILMDQGAKGMANMTTEFKNFGTAADVAAIRMDNLKGDLDGLMGSLETAFIGAGSGGNDFLRGMAQGATDLVNSFNDLSPATQQNVLKVAALVGGAALAAGGLAKLVVGIAATRTALIGLGIGANGARAGLASLSGAGLLAIAGFVAVQAASAAMSDELERNSAGIDGYKDSLNRLGTGDLDADFAKFGDSFGLLGQGVKDTEGAFAALEDTFNPVSQGFRKVGDALGMASTAGILADEFDKIDKSLVQMDPDKAAAAFSRLSDQARDAGLKTEEINATFDDYKAKQKEVGATAASSFRASEIAFRNGAVAAKDYGGALDAALTALSAIDPSMKRTAEQSSKLAGSLFAQGDAFQNSVTASSAYEAAIDEANKTLDKTGKFVNKSKTELKDNTAEGRENIAALNGLASSGKAYVQSLIQQGAGADKAKAATREVREEFIAAARDAGLGKEAAKDLADSYGLIPSKVSTTVEAFGLAIQAEKVKAFQTSLSALPAEQRSRIISIFEKDGAEAAQNALAAIKDKQVIAKAKAVGADDVKGMGKSLKELKDRRVEAKARGDKKQVVALDNAMKALKDKQVAAKVRAEGQKKTQQEIDKTKGKSVTVTVSPQGIVSTQTSINGIKGKTVTVYTKHVNAAASGGATGGLFAGGDFSMRGPLRRSAGGPVWGAGTATSDSIPALLSDGEFVINARSVRMLGAERLAHMNRTGDLPGFAAGGAVGSAVPRGVDFTRIWALIAAMTRPLAGIIASEAARAKAAAVLAKENRELAAARRAVKVGGATPAEKANLTKQAEEQRNASSKLTETTNNLRSAQQALADQARSQSEQFAARYRSTSTDPMDWLTSLREGAAELKAFQGQLLQLRKLGVSETIVQQIAGMAEQDAEAASELAKSILTGGKALAGALNQANGNLQKVADGLGYDVVQATGRYATGGPVAGPGSGTSDSILARVSNGEWVVPAKSVGPNLGLLKAMTYGTDSTYVPAYASGGPVGRVSGGSSMDAIAAAVEAGLSRASFTGYFEGKPFDVRIEQAMSQAGRDYRRRA